MSNALEKWFDNKRLTAFSDFSRVHESFDRLFNELMTLRKGDGKMQEAAFSPSCEIAEEGDKYVLKFDLPGVLKDKISIEVNDDQLTVQAERQEERKHESKKTYFSELSYGVYTRSFSLPGPVDEKQVEAKFENGVLTVLIPKTEKATIESSKTKKISIQ